MTEADFDEVAAWIRRWRPAQVDFDRRRILCGRLVFTADAVKKLIIRRRA